MLGSPFFYGFEMKNICVPYYNKVTDMYETKVCSLADCKAPATPQPDYPEKVCNKKEEIPMSSISSATVVTAESVELKQRKYLMSRIYDVTGTLKEGLRKQFGMNQNEPPMTFDAFFAAIKAGNYELAKDVDGSNHPYIHNIRWVDKSITKDEAGYTAAKAVLAAARQKAEDAAQLLPIADAVTAFEAFQTWTLPAATTTTTAA